MKLKNLSEHIRQIFRFQIKNKGLIRKRGVFMKQIKRFISILCTGIITISAIYSDIGFGNLIKAFATPKESDASITSGKDDIVMNGTNSFGNLLADTLSKEQERQEESNGGNIFEVTIEGTQAHISFETSQDAAIVVGIYTESGEKMLASGTVEILAGQTETDIEIKTEEMPQYFLLRAFMVNKETLAPLCSSYESPNYTREMQEFLAKTTDDFVKEKVLNLDEDKTNNFAVYKDDIVQIQAFDNINQIVSMDETNQTYVIENADAATLSLQSGDIFSYQSGEENLLIIKIKNIRKEGSKVTITAEDTSLSEVFDYVKIDSSADMSKAEINPDTCDEGVIYNGLREWKEDEIETYAVDIDKNSSMSASYTLEAAKMEFEGNAGSASVTISGGLEIKMENSIKVYISFSYQYIEWKLDSSVKVKAEISGEIEGKMKLGQVKFSPIPAVNIVFTPSFVVKASVKIELSGELKSTIGFRVDSDTGGRNISSAPTFKAGIEVEGTIFIGLSLEPSINIIDEHIVKAGVEAVVGVELKAKINLIDFTSSSEEHECNKCLEGEIYGKFEIKFEVQVINSDKLKFEKSFENKLKVTDFYYSFTFNEFGWGTCPHIGSMQNTISLGEFHSAAITETGDLYLWGDNEYGQLGDGTTEGKRSPIKVMEKIKSVSLGNHHSAAITETGDLYLWGSNNRGQLGDGTTEDRHVPTKVMEKVKSVSLGGIHSVAITETGDLYLWGSNNRGQLGDGTTEDRHSPIKVMEKVKSVGLGFNHSAAITETGDLYLWGSNISGELGNGTRGDRHSPTKVMEKVKSVSLGFDHSAAITETGDLYTWGSNNRGQLGDGTTEDRHSPIKVMEKVKSVGLGFNHSAAITETGDLYLWGWNLSGKLGDGTEEDKYSPTKVMEKVKSVSLGRVHSAVVTEAGDLYLWGSGYRGQLGDGIYWFGYISTKPTKIMENIKLPTSPKTSSYFEQPIRYSINDNVSISSQSEEGITISSYNNLTPNSDYIFCLLKSDTAENILSPDNLLYINQKTSENDGSISFSYDTSHITETTVARLSEAGTFGGKTDTNTSIPGDANNDGTINSKDAVLLKKYLAGYAGLNINSKSADVNADGVIDSKDAVRLLRHLAGYDVTLGK